MHLLRSAKQAGMGAGEGLPVATSVLCRSKPPMEAKKIWRLVARAGAAWISRAIILSWLPSELVGNGVVQ